MKKHLTKKALWQFLLSMIVSGIFILLAVGSFEGLIPQTELKYLDNGTYQEKSGYFHDGIMMSNKTVTGKRDREGRWDGLVTTNWYGQGEYTEEAHMAHGMRQGLCTRTYLDGRRVEEYYVNDTKIATATKAVQEAGENVTAFQALSNKYPWHLFSLNACGFGDDWVEGYLDTLEIVLNAFEFEDSEFDDYYDEAMDGLSDTKYDSLIFLNSNLTLTQGISELKNSELRLAVIDRYLSESNSTYNVITATYPGYLLTLNDTGVTDQDFEAFCLNLDDSLNSYGPLDPGDPFFIDSIDSYLYKALIGIMEIDASPDLTEESLKDRSVEYRKDALRGMYRKFKSAIRTQVLRSNPSEVAGVVVNLMLPRFYQGDIIRKAVREVWSNKKEIVRIPTVATIFSENISSTSVALHGYIIEDGGNAVTSSGIAWASIYNPTINDNSVVSGNGAGEFAVTLNGLTEGNTYYARAYAVNNKGIAYGNCIAFIAENTLGVKDNRTFKGEFTIYPNPASAGTMLSFQLGTSQDISLSILDMKGQVVLHKDLGRLHNGLNHIRLNLSGFQSGTYTCQLTNGSAKAAKMLVIAR